MAPAISNRNAPIVARYAFPLVAVALASILRGVLVPVLGEGVPFILYFPTVVLCAWFGGLWPGLLSAALGGMIALYFFIPPYQSFTAHDPTARAQLIVFLVASTLISLLADRLHRAVRRAQEGEAREREQRERTRVTLTSIGDAVIVTDDQGRVTLMNGVAQSLTGWSDADTTGRPLADVFMILNEHSRRPVDNPVARVLREGQIAGLANHTVLISRDGREIPIDDSAAPITDVAGTLLGAVLVFRDISQRRQVERERAQLLVREQTARREAEAANRTKDQFLAVLSHELRQPLNTMLGWLSVLRHQRVDAVQRERALDAIERNTRAQARMIDDLLDIARIEAGKVTLERVAVSLGPLIGETVESLQQEARAKGLTLATRLDPAAGFVSADVDRLRQVLTNVLANAIKYSPSGGRVEVRLTAADSVVRIVISDTGFGIEPDLLPHVFEPFRQAARSGGPQGGLGLGLAIVRELVDMHGGSVEAQSEGRGRGATFIVTLPVIDALPA